MTVSRLILAIATGLVVQLSSVVAEAKTVQLLAPGGGQVRALVVGINKYTARSIPTLKGAVADARDLEKTLRAAGVSDLTVLIDAEADRRRFEGAMNRLVEVSRSGDLAIISYAGHGSQTPELVKGSEFDNKDEVFLLSGFESVGPKTAERVVDDEMNHWLLQLQKKKVDVLYVADTCHGGGMMRAPDFRAGELSYRVAMIDMEPEGDKLKPVSTVSDAKLTPDDLPDVTFLAAVNKQSKAPEVSIPKNDTLRGALSYAVARMMSGDGPASIGNGPGGAVTRKELFEYARQITYVHSQTKQTITTEPASSAAKLDKVVFRLKVSAEPPAVGAPTDDAIKLRMSAGAINSLSGISPGQFPFRIVAAGENADVVWDAAKGDVLNGYGDVIADAVKAADIPAIVDGVAAVRAIAKLSETGPQSMRLFPSDRRFRAGEVIRFEVDGLREKYLILANVSGNGRVRFLFPRLAGDAAQVADPTFSLPLKVDEPFGSDHVIAIVSDQRLEQVEAAIRAIDDQKATGKFVGILRSLQQSNRSVRIGMSAAFTAR
ncbi:caspase family protein [Bradyrhizobium sp. LjRoot220]|uniref:caspase family protein n=1 Tax=Bradyrhizobium sp. LjRoot220 TaxID=3342284 RepID=UPI003ECF4926